MIQKKPRIIVDPHFRQMDEIFSPFDRERLDAMADVIWGRDEAMPLNEFRIALASAEVIICGDWRYDDVLDEAPNLRAIIVVSGAFPLRLDYDACYRRRIRVLSVAPAFARQVAEMCLGMALDAAREISAGDRAMRRGDEVYLQPGNRTTFMLYDQPVGIIGYGSIARALHALLKPFNVQVSAYDPWISDGALKRMGVIPVSLEDLLRSSRVMFVLAAPTTDNRAMLSREQLEGISDDAVLVLASRAHVVDFDALTEMVLDGRFKVATDVFPTEPLAADHPIRNAEGAVLSAHRAGSVREGLWEIGEMVVNDLDAILRGLPPRILQNAEPELSSKYTVNRAQDPDEQR